MDIKGIRKRWLVNVLAITIVAFLSVMVGFSLIIRSYFYSGIKQMVLSKAGEISNVYAKVDDDFGNNFETIAKNYVEEFSQKDLMEVMIFNENNEVIISSSGFLPNYSDITPDYEMARNSEEEIGFWEGKSVFGESTMAATKCIYDGKGNYVGAVRCVVSLEKANKKIATGITILLFISLFCVIFMVISGAYFIKSITDPINEICSKAKLIAQGGFHVKISKKYDDEIGELCDTVNYMAEELDNSEKIKNEFISSVSHELRTPLTAIKGWAETMQICDVESDLSTIKKGLNTIVKEAARLSWIVDELLDFSSIKEKRINLIKEKIDILAELGEAVYMFKDRAQNEKKSLMYNEPKILPPILGDKNRIRQVFINIIDNALKYTSEGGGVSVMAGVNGDMVYVSVTDNGCGIPAEHLPNVTKKFYKANYLKRGSGIGLAVVDEIVTLHGGNLDIISEENFGTTVTVSFPILSVEDEESTENSVAKE